MLKKTIVYTNPFTDQQVSEDHYFHISKADLVEMELEESADRYVKDGKELTGMQAKLQRIIDANDGRAIMAEFKDIIRRSYGRKDGDRFIKSRAIWADFESSEAFSQLLFELCTDAKASAEFMNGVVPNNLDQIAAEVRAQAEKNAQPPPIAAFDKLAEDAADPTGLTKMITPQILTPAELVEMDPAELKFGLTEGRYKLS